MKENHKDPFLQLAKSHVQKIIRGGRGSGLNITVCVVEKNWTKQTKNNNICFTVCSESEHTVQIH